MEIVLNGNPDKVSDGCTLTELLAQLDLTGRRVAVEVNENIVPRSRHGEFRLSAGDRVEIVHAIGGG